MTRDSEMRTPSGSEAFNAFAAVVGLGHEPSAANNFEMHQPQPEVTPIRVYQKHTPALATSTHSHQQPKARQASLS